MNLPKNSNYISVNKNSWDKRAEVHLNSEFYQLESFLAGKTSLNDIELELLGEVKGKSILHLQCHFGMDTLSLARMGAEVTGMDFSDVAIEAANKLANEIGKKATFICSDIYNLDLDKKFDIVYSSYGVIGWLPDMSAWATIIKKHLKPGGKFVFVEFHPIVWMFDDNFDYIKYNYSKESEIIEEETGTYAVKDSALKFKTITWNHSLSEVIGALLVAGLELDIFQEFDYSPYNCFKDTLNDGQGKYRIKKLGNKIPMIYSIVATNKID